MSVLIDVNVALDVVLERQPWLDDSKGVWDACYPSPGVGRLTRRGFSDTCQGAQGPATVHKRPIHCY